MRSLIVVLFLSVTFLGCGTRQPTNPIPKNIMIGSYQYLGDGIVTFTVDGSFDVWVYIPGKGERNMEELSRAELKDVLRRLGEKIDELKRLQKIYEGSTVSPQTAVRTPPGGFIFPR